MYEYIKGMLVSISPEKAIVDVNGIGYALHVPISCMGKAPKTGETVHFFVSLVVREDAHRLFGFLEETERDLYEKLSEVSGVGPKTALALIGYLPADQLQLAIAQANVALLSKVPGIGKKTAERLIVDMRDKLKKWEARKLLKEARSHSDSGALGDATAALMNLGYNQLHASRAAQKALDDLDENPGLSELITAALKLI